MYVFINCDCCLWRSDKIRSPETGVMTVCELLGGCYPGSSAGAAELVTCEPALLLATVSVLMLSEENKCIVSQLHHFKVGFCNSLKQIFHEVAFVNYHCPILF